MRIRISAEQAANSPLLIALLLIVGAVNLIWPQAAWELSRGWEFKNAEPSDEALLATRVGGGLLVFLAIVMFFGA